MARGPDLEGWLRLTLAPGLGPAALRALLGRFGLPAQVLANRQALPPEFSRALDSDAVSDAVSVTMEWLGQPGRALVTLADVEYPKLLLEIPDPPPVLYCRGRVELLARPALAVVGSRNATAQGKRDAETFSRTFSAAGITIVSGLAQGVDAAAHRGGLAGGGSTIAVLGTGVDRVYPQSNAALAADIERDGLLLSEFPLGTRALPHHFPRRNRLISGLAQGCLVIEAALASGSLITARTATEQGRDVFALPGSIHSPLSKGCHALIKSGAKLVESAEDVLAELPGFRLTTVGAPRMPEQPADASPLLEYMGVDPVDVDSLSARSGQAAQQVSAELLRLELAGRVAALPGGLYQKLH
jgi:DNA processing protein